MKTLTLLIIVAAMCGRQSMHPRGARLTKPEAISIAKQVATQHQEQLERYQMSERHYDGVSRHWKVWFHQKTPYTYGSPETYHYFGVTIDDQTGKTSYEPFALK